MNITDLWNKILDYFGLTPESEDDLVQDLDNEKIISIYKKQGLKIMLHEPESFSEVESIIDELKSRKPIILNLQLLEKDAARRIIDFVSGAVYGMDGNIQKIAESVFIFTPSNVEISKDHRSLMRKSSFTNPFGGEK